MKTTTRQELCDEIAHLASVRGNLKSLGAVTWQDTDYFRDRIKEVQEKLLKIQNKLHKATWSERTH
jgi:hypothetical protein